MKTFLAALVAALIASVVQAESRPCVDTLAGAQYGEQLKAIPNQIAVGIFARTFGDAFPVVQRELNNGRAFVRVNLLWSDTHSFGDSDVPFIKKEAARYEPLCAKYQGKVELSPFTEHNLNNPDKYLDITQAAAPSCRIINTPWKGALSGRYKNEVHGDRAPPAGAYNYSYDGTNAVDSDVEAVRAKHAKAEMFCIWAPRLNLRWSDKDSASRAQRIKEARDRKPVREDLESYSYLHTTRTPIKATLPKGWLVKSHSEKHDANDRKGDKLLIIAPIQANVLSLRRNGKEIVRLPLYGPFDGGGYRYYAPGYGYSYGKNLDVCIAKKCYGRIDAGFRSGAFR